MLNVVTNEWKYRISSYYLKYDNVGKGFEDQNRIRVIGITDNGTEVTLCTYKHKYKDTDIRTQHEAAAKALLKYLVNAEQQIEPIGLEPWVFLTVNGKPVSKDVFMSGTDQEERDQDIYSY